MEYALCGGLAANIYGADRFTKDIDVLVAPEDLRLVLDLMIADGGCYASAYESRYPVEQEDVELWLVSREELIAMKREAGRPIDRQDIDRIR